jgi:hypothetical protein
MPIHRGANIRRGSGPRVAIQIKRLAAATITALALMTVGAQAAEASSGATIVTSAVSFILTSDTCSNLPAGTILTGVGTERSITTTLVRQGVTTLINSTHAQGTATDQDSNRYVFSYSNEFRASEGTAGLFTGGMTDHFSLAGNGPATLSNGFVADIATDFSTFFNLEPINSHGDPISFPDGQAHCDPL